MAPAKRAPAAIPEHVDFDFDALAAEDGNAEPAMVFKLGGRTWHVKNVDDLPWGTLDTWMKGQVQAANGDGTQAALSAREFYLAVLFDDEQEDFNKLLDQPKTAPKVKTIRDIAEKIAVTLFQFPTQPSSTSRAGRQRTRGSSTASSPSAGSQPRAS